MSFEQLPPEQLAHEPPDKVAARLELQEFVELAKRVEEAGPDTRRAMLSKFEAQFRKSRFLPVFIFAAAAHVPLWYGDTLIAYVKAAISQLEGWDGRILRPQSKEERVRIEARVQERMSRRDQKGIERYKEESRKQIEAGQPPSFANMQFKMEELNGVPREHVEAARKKAQSLIDAYAPKFINGFDEAELKKFVHEMYGPEINYESGQGSVTVYFNTGKRNCNAIATGQMIVIDGVLERMPDETRKKYQLGKQYVQQHTYATLSGMRRDGKIDKTYLLEPSLKIVQREIGEAGTATVSLDMLKQAILADVPVAIDAKTGTMIPKGPILDLKLDQPVDDHIVINGPLKPSDAVVSQPATTMKSPETSAIPQEVAPELDVMELTLEQPLSPAEVRERIKKIDWQYKYSLNLREEILSPETIRALNDAPRISFGDVSRFSTETIEEMFALKNKGFFDIDSDEAGLPPQLFDAVHAIREKGLFYPGRINIFLKNNLSLEDAIQFFSKPKIANEIFIAEIRPTKEIATLMAKSDYQRIILSFLMPVGVDVPKKILEILAKSKPRIGLVEYYDIAAVNPWILQTPIEPAHGASDIAVELEIENMEHLKSKWMIHSKVFQKWIPAIDKKLAEWRAKLKKTAP